MVQVAARDGGGLYCYVATPFDRRGNLDTGTLREYVAAMLDSNIDGITCIASTCEGPYLTESERRIVAETVGKTAAGRKRLNVGIGAVATRQTIEYAKQARDAGATSLMLDMQQYFPIGFDAAYRHYQSVASAVDLPIRLYNITNPTRFDFSPLDLCRMAELKAISSIKEASGDVSRIGAIKSLCGDRYALYCGFHYQSLEAFRLGAIGWEAMLHPLIARPCVDLYRALIEDSESVRARSLYDKLRSLFDFFRFHGVTASVKALSAWTDLKLGKPRAPLSELPAAAERRLKQILAQLGVL